MNGAVSVLMQAGSLANTKQRLLIGRMKMNSLNLQ